MRDDLLSRYQQIQATIRAATAAAGAAARPVRLLAVSKGQSAAAVRALYGLGQREFGENYVQELTAKAAALADLPDLRWEYIGRLQSNKISLLARSVQAVQSLGDARHARLLAKAWARTDAPLPVHILVNAGDEATKDGVAMAEAVGLAAAITAELPALHVAGIMALPPPLPANAPRLAPLLYQQLRELATQIGDGQLSLGMSGDLWQAIAAGSTCVRIGTALFGPRAASR